MGRAGGTWLTYSRRIQMLARIATSVVISAIAGVDVYLLDTDVVSEIRKGENGSPGVREFFAKASGEATDLYLSVITIDEVRQGVECIRRRGDTAQAKRIERWLGQVTTDYPQAILAFDEECAHVWGRLRVPNPENPLDKQIAATALIHDLCVVTRNAANDGPTGVRLLNPFV
jgi:predicted nucleic acid-binding protein